MSHWQTQLEQLRHDHRTPLVFTAIIGLLFVFSVAEFITDFKFEHVKIKTAKAQAALREPIELANLHLFGTVITAPAVIPISTLQYTLEGTVVFTNNPSQSHALIASKGEPVKVYQVNDTLSGNVKITQIEKDYVVVNDGGSSAKIPLPINSLLTDDIAPPT